MKYEKSKSGSYIHNCHLIHRDDNNKILLQMDFENKPDKVCLNGYAIIPIEEYKRLKGEEMTQEEIDKIKQASIDILDV